jgi:hypothetical protein
MNTMTTTPMQAHTGKMFSPSFMHSFMHSFDKWLVRTDTERLGNIGNFTLGTNFNAQFPQFHNGTGLFTFLPALFRFALFRRYNGNSTHFISDIVIWFFILFWWHCGVFVFFCVCNSKNLSFEMIFKT